MERHGRPRRAARHPRAIGRRHPDLSRGHHAGARLRRQQLPRLGLRLPAARHVDHHRAGPRRLADGDAEHRRGAGGERARPRRRGRPRLRDHRDRRRLGSHQRAGRAAQPRRPAPPDQRDVRRGRAARRHPRRQLRQRLRRRHLPGSVRPVPRRRLRLRPARDRRQHLPPAVVHARLRSPRADDRPGDQQHLGRRRARRVGGRPTAPASRRSPSRRTSSSSTAARPAFRWTWRRSRTRTTLEAPIATLWQGAIGTFRIDINESEAPRAFRLSNVRLTADDAPNGSGFFPIRWRIADATLHGQRRRHRRRRRDDGALLRHRRQPGDRPRLIASGVNAASGLHYWNMAGLAPGVYYIYAVVTDGSGSSQGRYSTGPVRVSATIPAATDSNSNGLADAWETQVRRVEPERGRRRRRRHQPGRVPGRDAPAPVEHLDAAGRRDRLLRRAHRARQPGFDARRRHTDLPAAGAGHADHAHVLAAAIRTHDRGRQCGGRPGPGGRVDGDHRQHRRRGRRAHDVLGRSVLRRPHRQGDRAHRHHAGTWPRAPPTASSRPSCCWPTRAARRRPRR